MNPRDRAAYPGKGIKQLDGSLMDQRGLTKREAFAMAAMQGLLANSYPGGRSQPLSEANQEEIADMAVTQADALLNRLSLTQEPRT